MYQDLKDPQIREILSESGLTFNTVDSSAENSEKDSSCSEEEFEEEGEEEMEEEDSQSNIVSEVGTDQECMSTPVSAEMLVSVSDN